MANSGSQLVVTQSGSYTADYLIGACDSFASSPVVVTVNPNPDATITTASSITTGTAGTASVAAVAGATYQWSITNGTINSGSTTNSIGFTAGAVGTLTLTAKVTTSAGCVDQKSVNVTVTSAPVTITVTSINPNQGVINGGTSVTIGGTGFQSGATVSLGGVAATSVVVVNSTTITAVTGAHAAGTVNVVVTNPDTSSGTLTNGYTYRAHRFDPNGDGVVDPADIFYLVNYLFLNGPAPQGWAGPVGSGDANDDNTVDPADIFFTVNYLFLNGPAPLSLPQGSTSIAHQPRKAITGSIALGAPETRNGRTVVPVIVTTAAGSDAPAGIALRVRFSDDVTGATAQRAGATASIQPAFEIARTSGRELSWIVAFHNAPLAPGTTFVAGEIVFDAPASALRLELDPAVTMISNQSGTASATHAAGTLTLRGATVNAEPHNPVRPKEQQ